MHDVADEQLMALLQDGNRWALGEFVTRYHAQLLGYLYRLTGGDQPLAEDLVQETFIRLLRPAGYQGGRAVKPWLYTIATNLARDHFRSAEARRTASVSRLALLDQVDPEPPLDSWRSLQRIISDRQPHPQAISAEPTLEDAYLHVVAKGAGTPAGLTHAHQR